MNIILVSTECFPFTNESDLGDSVFALARALERLGCNIKVIMPRYGSIEPSYFHIERLPNEFKINFNNSIIPTSVYKGILPNSFVSVFFIESQAHFSNSKEIYLNDLVNQERFHYFSHAVLNIISILKLDVDLIHLFNSNTLNKIKLLSNLPVVSNIALLTGIDWEIYNPEKDPAIKQNYTKEYFTIGKRKCKEELLEKIGLEKNFQLPLIGIIARLEEKSEFKLLTNVLQELKNLKLPVISLIKGEEEYRKIFAASDFLLNINKTDGSLIQMAMRYGSIPIAYNSSAAKAIISDIENSKDGNGFIFKEYDAESLIEKVLTALKYYKNKEMWTKIVKQAMSFNSDSLIFAKEYKEVYKQLLETKKLLAIPL